MQISRSDWVDWAANYTLDYVPKYYKSRRHSDGWGVEHAKFLLNTVAKRKVTGTKAHRWLAYAQAILVGEEIFKLIDAKRTNKRASEELDVFNTNQLSLGL